MVGAVSEANWTQFIAVFGAVVVPSCVSCWFGWLAYQRGVIASDAARDAVEQSRLNGEAIHADLAKTDEVHQIVQILKVEVNDRLTQLLEVNRAQALLEGQAIELQRSRDEISVFQPKTKP